MSSEFQIPQDDEILLNPWFSMWTKPRATIHQIVNRDPNRMIVILAILWGISEALDGASGRSAGDRISLEMVLWGALTIGPIGGVIRLYFGAMMLRWTGRWLGGTASKEHLRAALAWSAVPLLWILPLWLIELPLFGKELFTTDTPTIDASISLTFTLLAFSVFELIIAFWYITVALKSIGEVQGFSAWKALGNVLLSYSIILLVIVMAVLPVVLIIGI